MIRRGIHASAVVDCLGSVHLPNSTVLEPLAVVYVGPSGRLTLGEDNILYPHASIRIDQGEMVTGREVSFGPGCHIYEPRAGLTIGDHCMIGGGTVICGVNHGFDRTDRPMRHQPPVLAPIILEDDVWLGMGVMILPGVRIGRGSVIGAGSVVTRDVPPYSIGAGVPFVVHRRRAAADVVP
jgi:acetyltransferase-like isoleucine patch superfamily enzyme